MSNAFTAKGQIDWTKLKPPHRHKTLEPIPSGLNISEGKDPHPQVTSMLRESQNERYINLQKKGLR